MLLQIHGLCFHQLLLYAHNFPDKTCWVHKLLVVFFQDWPLSTGEPVGVIFPGRATSPGFTQLTVVLCVGLRPLGLFWMQFGMFIGLLVQLMFGWLCWWGFMGVASVTTRRQNVTAKSPTLWLLQSVCSLLHSLPWALVFCSCIH